jgi:sugar/nucleoside kinase (ribokinase family)
MTTQVVVAGVVNVQQTVPVEGFPIPYAAVRYPTHRLRIEASGAGLNVASTLRALGTQVSLATLVGTDPAGHLVRDELDRAGLLGDGVLTATATPTSAVLVDPHGTRQINTDLKDIPDATYPPVVFRKLLDGAQLAVLSTIGFARPLIPLAQAAGVPIATDLQTIRWADDTYHQPWMRAADILFCSAEQLTSSPTRFARTAWDRFPAQIIVVGQGADGCLLAVRGQQPCHLPAVAPHGVIDTTGAGDALLAGSSTTGWPPATSPRSNARSSSPGAPSEPPAPAPTSTRPTSPTCSPTIH